MVKTCFFAAPSGPPGSEIAFHSENTFQRLVLPACRECGLEPIRFSPSSGSATVTQQSLSFVIDADLLIADITNSSPNILYEVGLRHAIKKPLILIARQGEQVPFDIVAYRILFYRSDAPAFLREARAELIRSITAALTEEVITASPASDAMTAHAREIAHLAQISDGLDSGFGAVLRGVSERLASIEEGLRRMASHPIDEAKKEISRDIFIVHGHDGELKNELARFLEKLDFNPIILHERPDRGLTIIQKLQYEAAKVSFAFILHTPDDEGRKRDLNAPLQSRSRQNVVFEHGMFIGQFSASRVCAIVREGVEIPSDLTGVIYKFIPKGGGISTIGLELIKELREAGYVVDANKA
jgi:predicted nucleotide-binding protein